MKNYYEDISHLEVIHEEKKYLEGLIQDEMILRHIHSLTEIVTEIEASDTWGVVPLGIWNRAYVPEDVENEEIKKQLDTLRRLTISALRSIKDVPDRGSLSDSTYQGVIQDLNTSLYYK